MAPVRHHPDWPSGQVIKIPHRSRALEGNPWQDPVERDLCVYLPPDYREAGETYLALWDFAAFTNSGPGHLNWKNHGENLAQRLNRLIHEQAIPPVVVAMPDCYSSLGGNQYLNSASLGRYADYVALELLPLLSQRVNVASDRSGRGVFGKSSGGYGALVHAMDYPEHWGAVAAHAADCGFDLVYRPAFPAACRVLAEHGGEPVRFLEHFWSKSQPGGSDYATLMAIAMAASYDPNESEPLDIRLPVDLHTCTLDQQRWQRWLAHDPLNRAGQHVDALKSLHCLYLDVGSRDQYNIQFGMRTLSAKLDGLCVEHEFEEFDGSHSHLDWRLDHSLPKICTALVKAQALHGN